MVPFKSKMSSFRAEDGGGGDNDVDGWSDMARYSASGSRGRGGGGVGERGFPKTGRIVNGSALCSEVE